MSAGHVRSRGNGSDCILQQVPSLFAEGNSVKVTEEIGVRAAWDHNAPIGKPKQRGHLWDTGVDDGAEFKIILSKCGI
jgi:hypothetical protein